MNAFVVTCASRQDAAKHSFINDHAVCHSSAAEACTCSRFMSANAVVEISSASTLSTQHMTAMVRSCFTARISEQSIIISESEIHVVLFSEHRMN